MPTSSGRSRNYRGCTGLVPPSCSAGTLVAFSCPMERNLSPSRGPLCPRLSPPGRLVHSIDPIEPAPVQAHGLLDFCKLYFPRLRDFVQKIKSEVIYNLIFVYLGRQMSASSDCHPSWIVFWEALRVCFLASSLGWSDADQAVPLISWLHFSSINQP